MQCPVCHNSLQEKTFNKIKVDVCNACHGIWFDYAEMMAIADSDTLDHVDNAFAGEYSEGPVDEAMAETPRQCPKDATVMERHEWRGDSKIVMDFCPECCGTWLDAGELEGYTAFLKHMEENPPCATVEQLVELEHLRAARSQELREYIKTHAVTPMKVLRQVTRMFVVPR